ncbi:MAG TPA: hypothetical protein PLY34_10325 [Ferruginibacter sp.]|nr:hypothetical protein [Ferruginibacter sp.]HPH89598.1 hypothetical protein [Ferruginibacter sp.]
MPQQIPEFNKGNKLSMGEIYDYIKAHINRSKNNNEVNLELEKIGVGISGSDITELMNAGATDFIALHAVEDGTQTIILVGVNAERYLVRNGLTGDLIAIERWDKFGPSLKAVDDDINELYNVFN